MNNDKEIRDLFARHDVPLDKDDVWSVQSSRVVKHKALERLAAALKIKWEPPQVLRAERDEAVILVSGSTDAAREWSIGEALVNANYRVTGRMAPYVYAMAEKRAKDRVIIKLAGLHGVYSEDEADEFKDARDHAPAPAPRQESKTEFHSSKPTGNSATLRATLETAMCMCSTEPELAAWTDEHKPQIEKLSDADYHKFKDAWAAHRAELKRDAA